MKKLVACICVFVNGLAVSAQDGPAVIVFRHANVIDGVSNRPWLDVTVLVVNKKIAAVGKHVKKSSKAEVIDLGSRHDHSTRR